MTFAGIDVSKTHLDLALVFSSCKGLSPVRGLRPPHLHSLITRLHQWLQGIEPRKGIATGS